MEEKPQCMGCPGWPRVTHGGQGLARSSVPMPSRVVDTNGRRNRGKTTNEQPSRRCRNNRMDVCRCVHASSVEREQAQERGEGMQIQTINTTHRCSLCLTPSGIVGTSKTQCQRRANLESVQHRALSDVTYWNQG